jgi:hypothetical protein
MIGIFVIDDEWCSLVVVAKDDGRMMNRYFGSIIFGWTGVLFMIIFFCCNLLLHLIRFCPPLVTLVYTYLIHGDSGLVLYTLTL